MREGTDVRAAAPRPVRHHCAVDSDRACLRPPHRGAVADTPAAEPNGIRQGGASQRSEASGTPIGRRSAPEPRSTATGRATATEPTRDRARPPSRIPTARHAPSSTWEPGGKNRKRPGTAGANGTATRPGSGDRWRATDDPMPTAHPDARRPGAERAQRGHDWNDADADSGYTDDDALIEAREDAGSRRPRPVRSRRLLRSGFRAAVSDTLRRTRGRRPPRSVTTPAPRGQCGRSSARRPQAPIAAAARPSGDDTAGEADGERPKKRRRRAAVGAEASTGAAAGGGTRSAEHAPGGGRRADGGGQNGGGQNRPSRPTSKDRSTADDGDGEPACSISSTTRRSSSAAASRARAVRPVATRWWCAPSEHGVSQIAVLEGRNLIEHYVSEPEDDIWSIDGNIYLGRVQNVLPGMEAAFIDIGTPKNGVLYHGDVALRCERGRRQREARASSGCCATARRSSCRSRRTRSAHKGARLTQEVSLAGRFVVMVPGQPQTYGISKRLPDDERKRLRRILERLRPDDCGLIVRTAAEGATEEELERDMRRLQRAVDADLRLREAVEDRPACSTRSRRSSPV